MYLFSKITSLVIVTFGVLFGLWLEIDRAINSSSRTVKKLESITGFQIDSDSIIGSDAGSLLLKNVSLSSPKFGFLKASELTFEAGVLELKGVDLAPLKTISDSWPHVVWELGMLSKILLSDVHVEGYEGSFADSMEIEGLGLLGSRLIKDGLLFSRKWKNSDRVDIKGLMPYEKKHLSKIYESLGIEMIQSENMGGFKNLEVSFSGFDMLFLKPLSSPLLFSMKGENRDFLGKSKRVDISVFLTSSGDVVYLELYGPLESIHKSAKGLFSCRVEIDTGLNTKEESWSFSLSNALSTKEDGELFMNDFIYTSKNLNLSSMKNSVILGIVENNSLYELNIVDKAGRNEAHQDMTFPLHKSPLGL